MNKRITTISLCGLFTLLTSGCAELTWQSPFDVGGAAVTGQHPQARVSNPDDIELLQPSQRSGIKVLSVVTGDSSQTRMDQPAASNQQALQFLREDAARFGAQAIIDHQCYQLPKTADSQCYTQVSCFGKAVLLTD